MNIRESILRYGQACEKVGRAESDYIHNHQFEAYWTLYQDARKHQAQALGDLMALVNSEDIRDEVLR